MGGSDYTCTSHGSNHPECLSVMGCASKQGGEGTSHGTYKSCFSPSPLGSSVPINADKVEKNTMLRGFLVTALVKL